MSADRRKQFDDLLAGLARPQWIDEQKEAHRQSFAASNVAVDRGPDARRTMPAPDPREQEIASLKERLEKAEAILRGFTKYELLEYYSVHDDRRCQMCGGNYYDDADGTRHTEDCAWIAAKQYLEGK